MKKNLIAAGIIVIALAAVVLARTGTGDTDRQSNPVVMATVFPIYDIARNVAGDSVSVELLLPPGAEPHTFEPSPSDLLKVRRAAVMFAVGHGIDDWASRLGESTGTQVMTVDENVRLLEADRSGEENAGGDGYDPHYWLSAPNAAVIASNVAGELTRRFPEHADEFAQNLESYTSELAAADDGIKTILSDLQNRNIATFHGAFRYFADAYGLTVAAEFEEYPGREPSARYLSDLKSTLEKTGTTTLYSEPNFNSSAIAVFAEDNSLGMATLDPLGGADGRDSLVKTLFFNANEIARNQD